MCHLLPPLQVTRRSAMARCPQLPSYGRLGIQLSSMGQLASLIVAHEQVPPQLGHCSFRGVCGLTGLSSFLRHPLHNMRDLTAAQPPCAMQRSGLV